ncbi:MAG: GNAT family N-acetyltransferase [Nanoarchaeota archaeon]|nr:GNAT family N-acetyltransferase [Nanoarchaeota archaeon]
MDEKIIVREGDIEGAVKVNSTIREFGESYSKGYFEERYKGEEHLVIVAYINNLPVGYIVSYDRFDDGSFYCWMAGVNPEFRKKGILKELMSYQDKWARDNGYTSIKIKTRNNRREMLSYLIKYGFLFVEVVKSPNIEDNRILLEKPLI